jgi:MFS superfamily sulfate permease-like transporter
MNPWYAMSEAGVTRRLCDPVSLAYAGLAGLPPQIGIYGYMLGGIGYALLDVAPACGDPTSAISLMISPPSDLWPEETRHDTRRSRVFRRVP